MSSMFSFFFFNDTATTEIYTLSLHDALPISKREEDPLVAIDGARVRAAIEWKGLSVNGAAGRIDVSQQTLDSIVRGKTKRCYKGLRESLARLLDLPAAWLGGETDLLPSLTTWLPYPRLRN